MIQAIFRNNRIEGYATVGYSSSDESEIIIPISENNIVGIVGENWKNEYDKLILVDGKIEVDEEWEQEKNEK